MDSFQSGGDSFDDTVLDQAQDKSDGQLELEVRKLLGNPPNRLKWSESSEKSKPLPGKNHFTVVVEGHHQQLHSSGIPPSPRTGTLSSGTPRAGGVAGSLSENALRHAIVTAQRTILNGTQPSPASAALSSGSSSAFLATGRRGFGAGPQQTPLASPLQRSSSRNTLGGVLLEHRPAALMSAPTPSSVRGQAGGRSSAAERPAEGVELPHDAHEERPCGQCGGTVRCRFTNPSAVPELERRLVVDIQCFAKSLRRI
jgi:hypothetical protein